MDVFYTNGMTVFAWAVACTWIGIVVFFINVCRKQSLLLPMVDSSPLSELPKLSVLVAARNESFCIETCIRSLFRQD